MPTARQTALLAAALALLSAPALAQSLVPSVDAAAGAPPSPTVVPQAPGTGPETAPGVMPYFDWSGWTGSMATTTPPWPNYQGNVNPGLGDYDYTWQMNPGLDVMVGGGPSIAVSPSQPGPETFPVQCVTPAGYCEFTSDTRVAAGLPCHCDGSDQPGQTR